MNNSNNSLEGKSSKRKKAYTKEQVNAMPDHLIVGNSMKFASFLKNNLNMDYHDAIKKATPLVDTEEGLALIRKIKAEDGQKQMKASNSVVPVDLNQSYTELPEVSSERHQEIKLKEPVKVQGIKPKSTNQVLEPYTSNYFLLLDIIPDLEKRLTLQDLEEISQRLDEEILDLIFNYAYQNEDGTHMINMIQPDGDDANEQPDLNVLLKVDPVRKMTEVISFTDSLGNTHKVYSNIDGETHVNHSIKTRLNKNLTEWLKGFKAQAHRISTLEEKEDQYYDSREFWKEASEEFEKDWLDEERKNEELRKKYDTLDYRFRVHKSRLKYMTKYFTELQNKHDKIIEIMKPLIDEMMGEEVIYNGRKRVIETDIGFFRYLAHILKVKNNQKL